MPYVVLLPFIFYATYVLCGWATIVIWEFLSSTELCQNGYLYLILIIEYNIQYMGSIGDFGLRGGKNDNETMESWIFKFSSKFVIGKVFYVLEMNMTSSFLMRIIWAQV